MGEHGRLKPSQSEQDAYHWLRSNLTAAIAQHIEEVKRAAPAVADAMDALNRFKDYHPRKSFRIFRPEDAGSTDDARDKLFLR